MGNTVAVFRAAGRHRGVLPALEELMLEVVGQLAVPHVLAEIGIAGLDGQAMEAGRAGCRFSHGLAAGGVASGDRDAGLVLLSGRLGLLIADLLAGRRVAADGGGIQVTIHLHGRLCDAVAEPTLAGRHGHPAKAVCARFPRHLPAEEEVLVLRGKVAQARQIRALETAQRLAEPQFSAVFLPRGLDVAFLGGLAGGAEAGSRRGLAGLRLAPSFPDEFHEDEAQADREHDAADDGDERRFAGRPTADRPGRESHPAFNAPSPNH